MIDVISKKTLITLILLLPGVMLTVLFRLPSYIPFTWKSDETDYLTAVRDLSQEGILYLSYGDLKPPLLFWLYQWVCALGGGIEMLYIKHFGMLVAILTTLVLFFIARQLAENEGDKNRLGFIAAILYALFSICADGEEMLATNSEMIMNLFVVSGYLVFLFYLRHQQRWIGLVIAAGLLCLGFLVNQKAGINLLVFAFILGWMATRDSIYDLFRQYVILGLTFATPILLLLSYYFFIDGLSQLQYWLLQMPSAYIGSYHLEQRIGRVAERFGHFFSGYWALIPFFFWGLWKSFKKKQRIKAGSILAYIHLMLVLYLVVSAMAVMVGGKMMERYFIQLLPPFILLSTLGISDFYQWVKTAVQGYPRIPAIAMRWVVQIFLAVWIVISPWQFLQQHQATSKPTLRDLQTHPEFKQLQTRVNQQTSTTDRIFVFPKDPYYYYLLQRANASRYLEIETHLSKPAMYPEANDLFNRGWQQLFVDLQLNQPKLVIDTSANFGFKKGEPEHIRRKKQALKQYIHRHYYFVGQYRGDHLYQLNR